MKQLSSLRVSSFRFQEHELLCDFSSGVPRPLLLLLFRYPAFSTTHTLLHPGIGATKCLMAIRGCQFCQ